MVVDVVDRTILKKDGCVGWLLDLLHKAYIASIAYIGTW
jgi:hypothetical protein